MRIVKQLSLSYFVLAVVGLSATWYYNIRFFAEGGSVAPSQFFGSAFANNLTTAITIDISFCAGFFNLGLV